MAEFEMEFKEELRNLLLRYIKTRPDDARPIKTLLDDMILRLSSPTQREAT